jgi:type IV fimbrial biogenesis protein FimT
MNSQFAQRGVTLIELLVVITIAAILMSIGVPSYKYVTTSNRVANEINALLADMQFARYEAVKEGLTVQVCPAAATATTCTASATWSGGWIVLSNAAATNNTAIVLRRQLPFSNFNSSDTLTNTATTAPTAPISFNREGFAVGLTTGPVKFSLYDPNTISSYTRCLIVGVSGALSTAKSGDTVLGTVCS